jgi:maleate cis-trans isomerase
MMVSINNNHPLGWRAKIGVIAPTENSITEPEFNAMKPDGVTVHITRMPIHFHPEEDGFKNLLDDLEIRLIELKTCGVDTVAYNCTVGSMACPADLLINKLRDTSGVEAVSTTGSILQALKTLGVSKIALATPYPQAWNEHEKAYLADHGFDVVAMAGLEFPETGTALGRRFGEVSPSEIFDHVLAVDHPDADAILISCANFGSASIVAELEAKLGKPVITSNIVTLWASLRAANINEPIEGYGRLLSEY